MGSSARNESHAVVTAYYCCHEHGGSAAAVGACSAGLLLGCWGSLGCFCQRRRAPSGPAWTMGGSRRWTRSRSLHRSLRSTSGWVSYMVY
jgi:hypothetical protein